jgi:hypothetical protein
MDSLNRFDNSASYALSKTPWYSQNRDSWHNVGTARQTELECGMRLCLDASMIAQYRGTLPKRMKSYGDIDKDMDRNRASKKGKHKHPEK